MHCSYRIVNSDSYRIVMQLSNSGDYTYRIVMRIVSYRIVMHLSNSECTYRIVMHLSNSDALIE